jgi:hypothetical protein
VNAGGTLTRIDGRRIAVVAEHPVPAFRLAQNSGFVVSVTLDAAAALADDTRDERE